MDFLGLRTLTIIRDTVELVKKNHNVDINIDEIPIDDEKTFQLFWKGQTTGVFQFESGPMREYLKKLQPNSIRDLSAMNALYRPGPMDFIDDFIDRKHGPKRLFIFTQFLNLFFQKHMELLFTRNR
jgi:DNA polymerase III subunit alpha